MSALNGISLGYDNNGNLRTAPSITYDYTPTNLMQSATVGTGTTRYAYDADDWRVKKEVVGGATTYYVRGPNGQLLTEWINTSPTATVKDYIYAGSRLIAVAETTTQPR